MWRPRRKSCGCNGCWTSCPAQRPGGADKADLYGHADRRDPPRHLARHPRAIAKATPAARASGRSASDAATWRTVGSDIYLGPTGEVLCKIAPFEREEEDKAFAAVEFMGFERERATLKSRCGAATAAPRRPMAWSAAIATPPTSTSDAAAAPACARASTAAWSRRSTSGAFR